MTTIPATTPLERGEIAAVEITGSTGGPVTLSARGELGEDVTDRFAAAARATTDLARTATEVIIDLTAVTYLSLESLTALVKLARGCAVAGVPLRMHPSPIARSKIRQTGLDTLFPLSP
ncbi:STAS domain-containing protein [Amycolatopsis sp. NPDC051106]|uniref:STAS domain-containing protein n=1 Tax=unclassified Amycolatopsis TaxID=2618356 RepID=UPI003426BC0D